MSCKTFAQDLALLAAGCADPNRTADVRVHCNACPECRQRLLELERICALHMDAALEVRELPLARPEAPRDNSRNWATPIRRVPRGILHLRWLIPAGGVAALALMLILRQTAPGPAPVIQPPPKSIPADLQPLVSTGPSLATYHRVLRQSDRWDESSLDALLAQHDRQLLPSAPDAQLLVLRDY